VLAFLSSILSGFFYLLLFFVPLVLYPKSSELFEFNKIVLTYFATASILAIWLAKMVIQRKLIFRRTILDIPLVIFLISQILSTIFSIDIRTSLLGYYSRFNSGLLSLVSYSLLYWAFVSNMDRKSTRKALLFLISSASVVSLYGVAQHFGIDKDVWVQDVQNRVFSTFGQPNWLAAWLAAILPLTWAIFLRKKLQTGWRKWLWPIASILFFLVLLYTKSRSGFLGLTISNLFFWSGVYWRGRKDIIRDRKFLIINGSVLVLIFLVGTPWTPNLGQILKPPAAPSVQSGPALEVGGTESGEIRKIVWRGAIDIWKHNPLVGTGVETFAYSYYNFRPISHNLVSEWDFLYNKAHNEYLNLMANTGALGLLGYFGIVGAYLWWSLQNLKRDRLVVWNLAFASGYIGLLVSNFFGFSVVPTSTVLFLYPAIAFVLVEKAVGDEATKKPALGMSQKALLGAIAIVLIYIVSLITRYWYADFLFAKGKLLGDAENYAGARNHLLKAVDSFPSEAIYWDELSQSSIGIALGFNASGDNEKTTEFIRQAISQSDKAISLSGRNVNLRRNRTTLYLKLAAVDPQYLLSARDSILETIILAPTDAKLYYNLGLTYARLGEIASAIETLEKTVEMKVNYRDARLALGILYAENGEPTKAREQFTYILEKIEPSDSITQQQLEEITR
jgi:O-antigen ligase